MDAAATLPDIPGAEPAGANLEFDPEFAELARLAAGKPEQQYGTTIVPAEDPDWKAVAAAAEALMARTYDLRVMSQLAVARLQREGLGGYAEALALIREVLETRWATVHPQLDPEDDNDPTLRANALLALADPVRVVRLLRNMPLARSVRAGTVSWRDISIIAGTVEVPPKTPKMTAAVIAAAFRETEPAMLAALREALASTLTSVTAIPAAFNTNTGHGTGPDLDVLAKLLREMQRMMADHAVSEQAAEADMPADGDGGVPAAAPAAPAMSIATMGPPTNRADAHEPSSPLPLLIGRALRLADKGFLDILRDMAPDGVTQAERIVGSTKTG